MDSAQQINIRGMVCSRCVETLKDLLLKAGFEIREVFLGKVIFHMPLFQNHRQQIRILIGKLGFEMVSDQNEERLSAIKEAVSEWDEQRIQYGKTEKLSEFLAARFHKNYDSLSEFFAGLEGITIEKYLIQKRVDKVKELLVYTDHPLSEIAFQLGFSSAHHLSSQFKKTTGLNPSVFRSERPGKMNAEEY